MRLSQREEGRRSEGEGTGRAGHHGDNGEERREHLREAAGQRRLDLDGDNHSGRLE